MLTLDKVKDQLKDEWTLVSVRFTPDNQAVSVQANGLGIIQVLIGDEVHLSGPFLEDDYGQKAVDLFNELTAE